jgi:YDG domain/MBG domain (YGX type)/S-layer homology domain
VTLSTDALGGDTLIPAYSSATFADKTIGVGKTVSVSGISLGGADAGNYTLLNTTASTIASISKRNLTVSATGVNKIYDGNTNTTVTLSTDKMSGDNVTPAYTSASFADKKAGVGKTVSVSGISISGADIGNYTLVNATATATANITPRNLTVSATGASKVYDGTTATAISLSIDKLAGDVVTVAYTTAAFADKNAGVGKIINVDGIFIGGSDAGNYQLPSSSITTTADILSKGLSVSATGINKVYDGTTAASVTLSASPLVGDSVLPAYTSAVFTDKNVGVGKTITVSGIFLNGADAGNYQVLSTSATTAASISVRPITVTAEAIQKYLGQADPPLTYLVTSGSLAPGDTFSGALAREPGEDPGNYRITQDTLTAGTNYEMTFIGNTFTILPAIEPTFEDVPLTHWAWKWIESIYQAGITSGCNTSPMRYCPDSAVTRAQMAVFLLRGIHSSAYTPPSATGTVFNDVPVSYWAAAWIEQLAAEGITAGCGGGNYCPDDPVTRDQMAIFLLRSRYGSAYMPPSATGTLFNDVSSAYWAAAWIEQLATEGITSGCGGGNYCPTNPVTRDQMAVFIQRTFNLPLP